MKIRDLHIHNLKSIHDMHLDTDFRPGVHRAGGFVQNQYGIVRQNGPGYGQQLLMALGHVGGRQRQYACRKGSH